MADQPGLIAEAHPTGATINLCFRYSELDYVRAMRAHYASVLRLKLDIAAIIVTASLGVYFLLTSDSRWYGIGLLGLSVLLALMLLAAFFAIPRVIFRRETKFKDEYFLAFSSERIHFRTQHIDSALQWNMYSRALTDAHSYILYYGTRSFTVIPKRVFKSADEQAAFERLLSQKIPRPT
ncbi:MAG: YcxB family protein [Candidatus Acidiferrales bacterium]